MSVSQLSSLVGAAGSTTAAGGTSPNQLGKDAFLRLLVTQLANQNPLSPVQDQEFVAQLAQFSSLEQLETLNETMSSSLVLDQAVNNSLATNLIGKEVIVEGTTTSLGDEGGAQWQLGLGGAASVTAVVRDATGKPIRTIEVGAKGTGSHTIEWDGLDQDGNRAAAGSYDLEVVATDASGNPVASSTRVRALVTGVRFADGIGYLVLGDTSIPLGAVVEVASPRNDS
jgi:flagellar basal-body rod modification protein FlgD